ncbi:hypothetical protein V5O48_005229 [Marasmius crinis-equi]|uniref:F-box domain-containing protein n=1 Tax=Marasmius crinis-equi TaxID=585013 RepID=A0ABR3FMY0_9AGAR
MAHFYDHPPYHDPESKQLLAVVPPSRENQTDSNAPFDSIPDEILIDIIVEFVKGHKIEVDGNSLKPRLSRRSFEHSICDWADSPILRSLHVCRRWRAAALDLSLWQDITVHQSQGVGVYMPPAEKANKDFLMHCMALAEAKGRGLKLTLIVGTSHQDDDDLRLRCKAFNFLSNSSSPWNSFVYVSNVSTSPRVLHRVLGSLGARKTQLTRFGMKLDWVLPEDTELCMPGLIRKMEKLVNVTRLEMDLGRPDTGAEEVWDWARCIPGSVDSGFFLRIRFLKLRCSPSVAYKVLNWCRDVVTVHLHLAFADPDPSTPASNGITLELKAVQEMVLASEKSAIGYGWLMEALNCPQLQCFHFDSPKWGNEGETEDHVRAFLGRARGRLAGRVFIPRATEAELRVFQEKGLRATNVLGDYEPGRWSEE